MRNLIRFGVAVIVVAGLLGAAPASAESCSASWGSTTERSADHPDSVMLKVRAGRHHCFDRFVVVVDGAAPGYRVRYVERFTPDASGRTVALRGGATLDVTMLGTRAHDNDGEPTYQPRRRAEMVDLDGYRTLRQAYWGGTFEGTTVVGLGVRARLPFRVLAVPGTGSRTRLVIDVAHAW